MIPGLDGLRAVAFLLVFLIHTDYLNFGWVGVQLFFVLSGFLITGILLDMKEYLPKKEYYIKFYGRRFLRIFPLYYFYLLLMTGLTSWLKSLAFRPVKMQVFLDQMPYAAVYVYNFFYASNQFEHTALLEHFWSLSVEEQFYIFWPLLIMLTPTKHVKKLFLGAIFGGLAFRILYTLLYRFYPLPFLQENMAISLYALPFTHLDAFGFGAFLTRFEFKKPKLQLAILAVLTPLLGFGTRYLATGSWTDHLTGLGYPFSMPKGGQYIWGYSVLNYLFALLIYLVIREKLFVRFLELPWLSYLGKISYGLYVYHFAIIWFTGRIILDAFGAGLSYAQAVFIQAMISFPLTVLVASLSYYFLEKPFLKWKSRLFSVRSRKPENFFSLEERPSAD
jgi:peptidoglycan/LPS O-acetylase OafA/YrhL